MKKILIAILLLFYVYPALGQGMQSTTLTYTPSPPLENGFILNIPFEWKIINCGGEVHVNIYIVDRGTTSSTYIFNGKRYTEADLGGDVFVNYFYLSGITSIMVDLYDGVLRLGEAELGNIYGSVNDCFGTFHITEMIGLKDAEYREKLANLSLEIIRIRRNSRNYAVENMIEKLEKERAKREDTASEDFWNSTENDKKIESADTGFWDTPENSTTQAEKEEKDWENAKERNTIISYTNYINNYPNGKYLRNATNGIAENKRKKEEKDWRNAKDRNTIISYTDYINNYPNGKYLRNAKNAIDKMEQERIITAEGHPTLIKVTGGTFTMGGDNEQPIHEVTLSDYKQNRSNRSPV